MGLREQLKDLDVDISNKCRQIEELRLECSRSERGSSILSNTLSVSRDSAQTRRNNNILLFDEKEYYYDTVLENLKDDSSNYVIVDFDGIYLKETADDFQARGYAVKSINLMNAQESDGYNPFAYIRSEADIDVIVQCILGNTNSGFYLKTPESEKAAVQNMEQTFLKILISCYMKYGTSKTLTAAVNLLAGEGREEKLDKLFSGQFPQGPKEMECKRFQIFKEEAGEQYSDIIQSCYERIVFFKDERLMTLTKKESLKFEHLYLAKEVLYIVIPSALRQVEMFTSLILSQICRVLCNETRKNNNDRTVMLYFNFLADVGAVIDLERMLPEFHLYNVGSMIHVNNFVRVGQIYENWETLFQNCDVIVYFPSYDEPTQRYVLERADTNIIRKMRVMGKEMYKVSVLKLDEIKGMDASACIIIVKGTGTFLSVRCGA